MQYSAKSVFDRSVLCIYLVTTNSVFLTYLLTYLSTPTRLPSHAASTGVINQHVLIQLLNNAPTFVTLSNANNPFRPSYSPTYSRPRDRSKWIANGYCSSVSIGSGSERLSTIGRWQVFDCYGRRQREYSYVCHQSNWVGCTFDRLLTLQVRCSRCVSVAWPLKSRTRRYEDCASWPPVRHCSAPLPG